MSSDQWWIVTKYIWLSHEHKSALINISSELYENSESPDQSCGPKNNSMKDSKRFRKADTEMFLFAIFPISDNIYIHNVIWSTVNIEYAVI